jgi:hypothetical protein
MPLRGRGSPRRLPALIPRPLTRTNPLTATSLTKLLRASSVEPDRLQPGATLPALVARTPRPRSPLHVRTIIPRPHPREGDALTPASARYPLKENRPPASRFMASPPRRIIGAHPDLHPPTLTSHPVASGCCAESVAVLVLWPSIDAAVVIIVAKVEALPGWMGRPHRQHRARPALTSAAACRLKAWCRAPYPLAVVLPRAAIAAR